MVIKEANVPNSLTKMLMDLFSHSTTASLFYTNDLLVVIDIITRQLTDLNPDDKVTTSIMSIIVLCSIYQSCVIKRAGRLSAPVPQVM